MRKPFELRTNYVNFARLGGTCDCFLVDAVTCVPIVHASGDTRHRLWPRAVHFGASGEPLGPPAWYTLGTASPNTRISSHVSAEQFGAPPADCAAPVLMIHIQERLSDVRLRE